MKIDRPLVVAIGGAVVGIICAGAVFRTLPSAGQEELLVEIAKAGIGLAPLAFFGVIVAGMVRARDDRRAEEMKLAEEHREQQRRLDEFRRRFLGDVVAGYNRVKSARRSIRAAGVDLTSAANLEPAALSVLQAQFSVLMDAQLDFERLRREAESRRAVFRQADIIIGALKTLEAYINDVGDDRETHASKIGQGIPMTRLADLPHFTQFMKSVRGGGDFRTAADQVDVIERAIWPDLRDSPSAV